MKLLSIGLAYGLDLIFGNPGWLPHPVRGIPKLTEYLEKKLRRSISLDSMVGYKNERYLYFGWFSAKLDDITNYIPARLSILLIPLVSFILRKRTLNNFCTILRDGRKSPSPNAGIPEAGFAGALGIQLGGVNYYQGKRIFKPILGIEVKQRDEEHIIEAIHLMGAVSSITFLGVVLILWYLSGLF